MRPLLAALVAAVAFAILVVGCGGPTGASINKDKDKPIPAENSAGK
jgi:hypothetical protein